MTLTAPPEPTAAPQPASPPPAPAPPPPPPPPAPPAQPRARRPRRERRPRRPRGRGAVAAAAILLVMSALMIWVLLYVLFLSALQQSSDQERLYTTFREQLSAITAPIGGVIPPGDPVAMMDIPALGVRTMMVVEGTSSADLRAGPGHRRDTPLPGQAGVAVLYGRGVSFGAPFGDIRELSAGATIKVTTGQGEFTYVVMGVRAPGDPLPAPPGSGEGRLTLVTAAGSGWQSGWSPGTTIYVDAQLQGPAAAAPPGRPGAVPYAERAMAIDSGSLVMLVLWLQLGIIVSCAVIWAWARWGKWQVWLVGCPVILAVLWGTTSVAAGLLPNLL